MGGGLSRVTGYRTHHTRTPAAGRTRTYTRTRSHPYAHARVTGNRIRTRGAGVCTHTGDNVRYHTHQGDNVPGSCSCTQQGDSILRLLVIDSY